MASSRHMASVSSPAAMEVVKPVAPVAMDRAPLAVLCTLAAKDRGDRAPSSLWRWSSSFINVALSP